MSRREKAAFSAAARVRLGVVGSTRVHDAFRKFEQLELAHRAQEESRKMAKTSVPLAPLPTAKSPCTPNEARDRRRANEAVERQRVLEAMLGLANDVLAGMPTTQVEVAVDPASGLTTSLPAWEVDFRRVAARCNFGVTSAEVQRVLADYVALGWRGYAEGSGSIVLWEQPS